MTHTRHTRWHRTCWILFFITLFMALSYGLILSAASQPDAEQIVRSLERVSISSSGEEGNNDSQWPVISANGRFVAFYSLATNLAISDTNGPLGWDVFVHDRLLSETTMVSVNTNGEQGNGPSTRPDISADGRYVVFASLASNLVISDTNNIEDVFLHDRQTEITTRVSVSAIGEQGNGSSNAPAISADGRYIVFTSQADNLVPEDTNNRPDVFVHDRLTGITERVSINSQGQEGNYSSGSPRISHDGRFVAFHSNADNLVPGDTNGRQDVFLYDRIAGQISRVTVSSTGGQGNDHSFNGDVSATGRYVVFTSLATNLVATPLNSTMNVYVHDRSTGQTRLVSQNIVGIAGNNFSGFGRLSNNEQYIAFHSQANNLVAGDSNNANDVFVFDLVTGYIARVSITPDGEQGNGDSGQGFLDETGKIVAFQSDANNLISNDNNNQGDLFVVEWALYESFVPILFYQP